MKIKLDENLPFGAVSTLKKLGHDADTVPQEGLAGKKDSVILKKAGSEKRFLITQDLDFADVRLFSLGHPGVLVLRLHDPGREALLHKIQSLFENEDVESWRGSLVIATDKKIRVRKVVSNKI